MTDAQVTRVELPSGGWAVMKDPQHVTVRQRKPILAVMGRAANGSTAGTVDLAILDDMLVAGACALVAQWSFGDVTEDAVLDLTTPDANKLQEVVLPLLTKLVPDLSVDGAGDADPASPTPA